MQSPRMNKTMHQYMLGANKLQSSLSEKDMGVLLNNKLTVNQQCALVAKKDQQHLGWVRKKVTSDLKSDNSSFVFSTGEATSVCCVQIWALQCKRYMDLLEQVQWKSKKMIKGWEHLSYKERLKELGLFSLKKRRLGGDLIPNGRGCRRQRLTLSGGLWQDKRKKYTIIVVNQWNRFPRGAGEFVLKDVQN